MTGEDLCGYIELRFYNASGVRQSVSLPEAKGVRFTEELGGDGGAAYRASLLALAMSTSPNMLESGFCKAAMVLQTGQPPVEVFAWEQTPTSGRAYGRPAEWEATPSGVGLRTLFSYMPLLPESGVGFDENTEDARLFGWMSVEDPLWYSASDWVTPTNTGTLVTKAWPRPVTAKLITADTTAAVGDVHLFRGKVTTTTSRKVRFYWIADDWGTLFLDGKELQRSARSSHTNTIDVYLQAGTHTIAASVKNTLGGNLRFCFSMCYLTTAGLPSRDVFHSDTTHWKTHKVVGGVYPGWSPGAILKRCLTEAQALSPAPYGSSLLTTDFTGAVDSEGVAFTDLHTIAFPIGIPISEVVAKLEELGYDVRVKPNFTVQIFAEQGTDVSGTVWFQRGANLITTDYQGLRAEATKVPVRTQQGWVIGTDATGVADSTIGVRYGAVVSSSAANLAQGQKLATNLMRRKAHHRYVYTHRIRAVAGAVPWLDFIPGAKVKAPDRLQAMVTQRVLSITAVTPNRAKGPVLFDVEAEVPW